MRTPSEMEATDHVALFEMIVWHLIEFDRGDFGHADHDECDEIQRPVVWLEECNVALCYAGYVALRLGIGSWVRMWRILVVGRKAPDERFRIVSACYLTRRLHVCARDVEVIRHCPQDCRIC